MIDHVTRDRLRLIFLREGKVAARAWARGDDTVPSEVREHLRLLQELLGPSLSLLEPQYQDSLSGVYLAAAKRARTDEYLSASEFPELGRAASQQRLGPEAADRDDDAHWRISADSAAVIAQFASDPSAGVSENQVATLYREIGRLCGPLLLSDEPDGFPALPDVAINALKPILHDHADLDPVFNELTHELEQPDISVAIEKWNGELFSAIRTSRYRYYFGREPKETLPSDAAKRAVAVERLTTERSRMLASAESSIEDIVTPMLSAYRDYLEELVTAAAQRAREDQTGRATAGFPPPEPQQYGVSPRGAEFWVADALRSLGFLDTEVTQQSADGGVDILAGRYAVSVKHYAGSVAVEEIREIFGVAVAMQRLPLLWTSGSLTASAQQFADVAPVGVVHYDVSAARWSPLNAAAATFLEGT